MAVADPQCDVRAVVVRIPRPEVAQRLQLAADRLVGAPERLVALRHSHPRRCLGPVGHTRRLGARRDRLLVQRDRLLMAVELAERVAVPLECEREDAPVARAPRDIDRVTR